MVHPQLPVPGLLGLFGALLVLSPQVATWASKGLTQSCVRDPAVPKALEAATEQYHEDYPKLPYYRKPRIVEGYYPENIEGVYHFTLEMVKTDCKKHEGEKLTYQEIQKCPLFSETPEVQTCYFSLFTPPAPQQNMGVSMSYCPKPV
ncbi:cystatin-like [Erythrolamprus reginae]|uniref:cystatin-like n=1 Tax=Erythrolamprus reginae TaxID=121349 RepID=UPI00396C5415